MLVVYNSSCRTIVEHVLNDTHNSSCHKITIRATFHPSRASSGTCNTNYCMCLKKPVTFVAVILFIHNLPAEPSEAGNLILSFAQNITLSELHMILVYGHGATLRM